VDRCGDRPGVRGRPRHRLFLRPSPHPGQQGPCVARSSSFRTLVATAVVGLALVNIFNLPYLSNDVFLYRAFGAMQLAGANPYTELPKQYLPPGELVQVPSVDQHSPYGPLALLLFRMAAASTPDQIGQVAVLKLLLVAPLAGLLVHGACRKSLPPSRRLFGLVWIGLNPLLLFEVFQSGHLEGWIACFLVLAITALRRPTIPNVLLSGVLTGLAVGMKLPTLVVCGAVAGAILRSRPAGEPWLLRLVPSTMYLAATLATLALCYAPYWEGARTLAPLRAESSKLFLSLLFLIDQIFRLGPDAVQAISVASLCLAFVAGVVVNLRGARAAIGIVLALTIQAAIARTVFHPWTVCPMVVLLAAPYLWPTPGEPAVGNGRISAIELAVLVWSVSSFIGGYAPFIFAQDRGPYWQSLAVAISFVPPVVVLAVAGSQRWNRGRIRRE